MKGRGRRRRKRKRRRKKDEENTKKKKKKTANNCRYAKVEHNFLLLHHGAAVKMR